MMFSIVIATSSPGKILTRALDSIIQQHFKEFEIVVQDNLSSDEDSEQVFKDYASQINLNRQKDNGIYHAFNLALERCRGQWVLFMGADDYLANEHVLENVNQMLTQHDPAQLILGKVINENYSGHWVPKQVQSQLNATIIWKNIIHQQGCLYNISWLMKHRFPEELHVLGDYAVHLIAYQEKTSCIQSNLTICHCDANGISKRFNKKLYWEEIKMKQQILPAFWFFLNVPWVGLKYLIKANF
jgi:putative colanic acid biosynthesis glycosyltransferase